MREVDKRGEKEQTRATNLKRRTAEGDGLRRRRRRRKEGENVDKKVRK